MTKLFFDIETIPCAQDKKADLEEVTRKKFKMSDDDDDWHHKTGLEGTLGRICCIAHIKEENGRVTRDVLSGDEKDMLTKFWQVAAGVQQFIGHNIWGFDLPFIYQRSIILKVKTRTDISFARYRNTPIYDTMCEWALWDFSELKRHKLDTLAKVMGLPTSKDLMDGSEVWQYFQDGRIKEICDYCMKDVVLVRQVYQRMTFEDQKTEDLPF